MFDLLALACIGFVDLGYCNEAEHSYFQQLCNMEYRPTVGESVYWYWNL